MKKDYVKNEGGESVLRILRDVTYACMCLLYAHKTEADRWEMMGCEMNIKGRLNGLQEWMLSVNK